jgi:hypothetical protein
LRKITLAIVLIVIGAGLFCNLMNSGPTNDEHLYVTSGVLVNSHPLYSGFPFSHWPGVPLLLNGAYHLTGSSWFYLTAKLVACGALLLTGLAFYRIFRLLTEDRTTSVLLLILSMVNYDLMDCLSEVWSASLALPVGLFAVYFLFSSVSESRIRPWGVALSGLLVALAADTRAIYVVFAVPIFLILLLFPRGLPFRRRVVRLVLPFVGGVLIGLVPTLYYLLTRPNAFLFDTLAFFRENAAWFVQWSDSVTLSGKLNFIKDSWKHFSNAGLTLLLLFLAIHRVDTSASLREALRRLLGMRSLLCIMLFLAAVAGTAVVTPLWSYYLATPIAILIILAATWLKAVRGDGQERSVQSVLISVTALCIIFGAANVAGNLPSLLAPSQWPCIAVHRKALELRNEIQAGGATGKVATMYPIYAIEAGLPIYAPLAGGQIFYRVGDQITPEERARFGFTSPSTLAALLESDPPVAVLVSQVPMEHDLDLPLVRFAEAYHYRKVPCGDMVLYLRE